MPAIREFQTPDLGYQPTDRGVDALASGARRIGAFYSQAAEDYTRLGSQVGSAIKDAGDVAVKHMEHEEVAKGAANFAQMQANLTQAWNDTAKNSDPNDTTVATKFREETLEPALEKYAGTFNTEGGQKFAEQHVAALRNHMFEKTTADMSTLAGEAAVVNHRQTVNALSNTVRSDPSSMNFSLDMLKSSTAAMVDSSPNLTGTAAAKVKSELLQKGSEEIIKAAALGHIEKTGEVPAWATDPKYAPYINGAELKQLAQAARYYQRLGQSEDRAARQQKDYEAKSDFNQKVNELEAKTMPENAGDRPNLPQDYWTTLRELSKHPGAALEPGRLRSMVQQGEVLTERLNKPEPLARVSHDTTMGLLTRLRATDTSRLTDNGPIYDAYQKGDLTNADFNFLTREFASMKTPEGAALEKDRGEFTKSYARLIDGMMNDAGIHSVLGTQRMYEFEMDARRQEAVLRKDGKDPHLVYDPRSPEFFGRPENIARYRVSLQEAQQYDKTLKAMDAETAKAGPAPKVGDRKEFKQGWGTWNGTAWVPEGKK